MPLQYLMDTRKVEIIMSATIYFEMKHYMRELPVSLTYQGVLDKSEVQKRSLAYYHKFQESTATIEANTTTAFKTRSSRSHHPKWQVPVTRETAYYVNSTDHHHQDNHSHEYHNNKTCDRYSLIHQVWGQCPAYVSTYPLSAEAGIIGQCVVAQLHSLQAGQTQMWTQMRQFTFKLSPKVQNKRL